MKRELQFKIWLYDVKHMVTFPIIGEEDADGHTTNYGSYTGKYTNGEWLQYTELKDKNKEKIFDGDIVRNGVLTGVVEYLNGKIFVCPINSSHKEIDLCKFCSDAEVIGNIYENPELLKEEQ